MIIVRGGPTGRQPEGSEKSIGLNTGRRHLACAWNKFAIGAACFRQLEPLFATHTASTQTPDGRPIAFYLGYMPQTAICF